MIFAGSEKRSALGMADVTLVLDNGDGLLPVDFSVLELGRRLYRSGENDYLLNKQRIRLRDLVDLLDGAHLADNAFLFIGQGMVDQALALRPEERRPLFEEVAGVRRHERRRRKAEEQLAESETNLARVEDILAELRPQARRLAAQAEQQTTRLSAGEELASALLAAAHVRWHEAAARRRVGGGPRSSANGPRPTGRWPTSRPPRRRRPAIAAEIGARAATERERLATHEAARGAVTELRLREARLAGDLEAIGRDRSRLRDRARGRRGVARRPAPRPRRSRSRRATTSSTRPSPRRSGSSPRRTASSRRSGRRAGRAARRRPRSGAPRPPARPRPRPPGGGWPRRSRRLRRRAGRGDRGRRATRRARGPARGSARGARGRADRADDRRGVPARPPAPPPPRPRRAAGPPRNGPEPPERRWPRSEARLAALDARIREDDERGIARAAKRRGGRRLDEELVVEPGLRAAVEAALDELARAYVVDEAAAGALGAERGIARRPRASRRRPAVRAAADAGDAALPRSRRQRPAARRSPTRSAAIRAGRSRRILGPDGRRRRSRGRPRPPAAPAAPAGRSRRATGRRSSPSWPSASVAATPRSSAARTPTGSAPRSRGSRPRPTTAAAESAAGRARRGRGPVGARRGDGRRVPGRRRPAPRRGGRAGRGPRARGRRPRVGLARRPARAPGRRRRARPRGASPRTRPAGLWGARRAAARRAAGDGPGRPTRRAAIATWERRAADLREPARPARGAAGRRGCRTPRGRGVAGRGPRRRSRWTRSGSSAPSGTRSRLAEREEQISRGAPPARPPSCPRPSSARSGPPRRWPSVRAADAAARDRLAAAERDAAAARERLRAADDRLRAADRADLEARLGRDALREQLLVELAGLGELGRRRLEAEAGVVPVAVGPGPIERRRGRSRADDRGGADADDARADDLDETAALEAALDAVVGRWALEPPPGDVPSPGRLGTLRRRYHELGAANPFAVDEYDALAPAARDPRHPAARPAIGDRQDPPADRRAEHDDRRPVPDDVRAPSRRPSTRRFQQLFGGGFARLLADRPDRPRRRPASRSSPGRPARRPRPWRCCRAASGP